MAIDISLFTLPCGVEAIKVIGEDEITREDATLLMSKVDPGGSLYRLPMLVLGQETRRLSLEARNLFSKPPPEGTVRPWCAVVVTSAIVRTSINFMLRVSKVTTTRMFLTEPAAVAWLDERAREDAASAGPS